MTRPSRPRTIAIGAPAPTNHVEYWLLPLFALLVVVLLLLNSVWGADTDASSSPKKIPHVGPAGPIERVQTGFQFVEGPAADKDGNVYFSECRQEKILRVDPQGKLTVFLDESGRANGLMFNGRGQLVVCESGAGGKTGISRIVAYDVPTREVTVLAEKFDGRGINRVNDLVVDRTGGVYFTDILSGEPGLPQPTSGVYYVSAEGKVSRLIDDLARPNGVILSPDEKTLYVLPAGTPAVMQYPVRSPGVLGKGSPLCEMPVPEKGEARGGDGLTVDTEGRLYVTVPALSAILVVTPQGEKLGLIEFPESPANCTFGGPDNKTLYVTARTSLYAVKMEATGHRFPGGRE